MKYIARPSKAVTASQPVLARQWRYQLQSGKDIRDAIDAEDYYGVIEALRVAYGELLDNGLIDEDDYERWTEDFDFYDLDDEEDAEEQVNYELDQFYDLCDNIGVWVSI